MLNNAKPASPLLNYKRRIHEVPSNSRKSRAGLKDTQDVHVSSVYEISLFYERIAMKIRLGPITIDPKRVYHFKRIGSRVCILQFITGESKTVTCGVKTPDNSMISFPGTPEDLQELLAEYIEVD